MGRMKSLYLIGQEIAEGFGSMPEPEKLDTLQKFVSGFSDIMEGCRVLPGSKCSSETAKHPCLKDRGDEFRAWDYIIWLDEKKGYKFAVGVEIDGDIVVDCGLIAWGYLPGSEN